MDRTILIDNLHKNCTIEELETHFKIIGAMEKAHIVEVSSLPHNRGYITWVEEDSVESALMFNDSQLSGVTIAVMNIENE